MVITIEEKAPPHPAQNHWGGYDPMATLTLQKQDLAEAGPSVDTQVSKTSHYGDAGFENVPLW